MSDKTETPALLSPVRLAEIEQRLNNAPGLPWAVNKKEQQVWSPSTGYYIGTEGTISDPEIDFIVNASQDVSALLADRAAFRQQVATELAKLLDKHNNAYEACDMIHGTDIEEAATRLGLELPTP